jgi:uncharacterized protein (DUF362 family)
MNKQRLYVVYGNDPVKMTGEILRYLQLETLIPPQARIGLKPNLVVGKPATSGATTHPGIAEAIIQYLQAKGYNHLVIMEGAWLGENTRRAFKICGYEDLAQKYQVPLLDLKADPADRVTVDGLTLNICRQAIRIDYLINLPVLKAHCQTKLTCALKNLKGCIPDEEKRRFHGMGLHQPIACLSSAIRPQLTIVDAICGDLTFEEGGNPVPMDRLIAGTDPVLIDAYAASLIGLEPDEVPYIRLAARLGVGTDDLSQAEIIEINPESKTKISAKLSPAAQKLATAVDERQACSACYGSLIHALHRLTGDYTLKDFPEKLKIGQGFRGCKGAGPGIGTCTRGLEPHLEGCPPKALEMKRFIEQIMH